MTPIKNIIHPDVKIGHIHLTVSDLERSVKFYRDLLGFEITTTFGNSAVFLSAGGYHHHIGLNTWQGKGATPPPPGHTGMYHFAILFPSRKELASVVKRLYEINYPIEGASDHGVSESIYLTDPDGNGVELYSDRPLDQWPIDDEGHLQMTTKHLDILNLLSELDHGE
ncbi:MAG: VOC family protein [Bacteroidetes bacterium]|nr:VOC family protein [Bacteroidota bacterium]